MALLLLTFFMFLVILLVGRLGWRLPSININWDINLRFQPKSDRPDQPAIPMPKDLVEYIEKESDEWARAARRTKARTLFSETGSWETVLRIFQIEDGN